MSEVLDVDTHVGVAHWTMRSAPVNAIESDLLDALDDALDRALADAGVCAAVLASDLPVFSAGADASWMARTIDEVGPHGLLERFAVVMDQFRAFCIRLRQSRLLTVAAIDGHVLAGGLELAAACDMRYIAADPRIQVGVPEMKLFGAMPSGGGGVQFLTRLMGQSAALRFILSGAPVTPAEAFRLRLADELVADGSARDAAITFGTLVAAQAGPIGVEALKTAVVRGGEQSLSDGLVLDRSLHWDSMRRGNFLASVESFARRFG